MANRTIGIVETEGMLDAFLAGDAMIKGANVDLTGRFILGGGVVTLIISGAPGAVKTAISIAEKRKTHDRIRTAIIPHISARVAEIMLSDGAAQDSNAVSGGRIRKTREKYGVRPSKPSASPKVEVPSIFDAMGNGGHLEETFRKKRVKEESETEVKKRQALIVQYLVANRNRKIAISDLERIIPNASKVTLRRDLNELIGIEKIEKVGRGRATHYKIL